MIRCEHDHNGCEICAKYHKCNLYKPCSHQLYNIKRELKWDIDYLKEIEQAINHYITVIYQYDHHQLPSSVMQRLNIGKIQNRLQNLRKEKTEIMKQIEHLRIREKNITQILERREKT